MLGRSCNSISRQNQMSCRNNASTASALGRQATFRQWSVYDPDCVKTLNSARHTTISLFSVFAAGREGAVEAATPTFERRKNQALAFLHRLGRFRTFTSTSTRSIDRRTRSFLSRTIPWPIWRNAARRVSAAALTPYALPPRRIERHGGHFDVTGVADRAAGGAKCLSAQKLQALNRRAAAANGGTRQNSGIEFPIV
jgi:hypothetical protein